MTKKMPASAFYAILVAAFIFWLIIFELGLSVYLKNQRAADAADHFQRANNLRTQIETEINIASFLATGIESYIVARQGKVDKQEMQKILALIYERGPYFRNIGIAPDNEVSMVYPLEGNEAAIGLRYQDNPKQWPAVQKIIESKQGLLAGPLNLIQGGRGLIYRTPVFIDQAYWGMLSTVIDADRIFNLLDQKASDSTQIALRGKDASGMQGEVFYGDPALFDASPILLRISVPGGEWRMAFKETTNASELATILYILFGILAVVMALVSSFLIRMWINRNLLTSLKVQVNQRTRELKQSNTLLESVLSSAQSFAIIALSPEGVIRLFNSGAERMLGYHKDELIGKASFSICFYEYQSEKKLFEILKKDAFKTVEMPYKHKNGERIDVQLVLSPIKSVENNHGGYLAIAEDITERTRIDRMKNEFLSTVSHELRTPLTAISGALGLIRGGVAGALPDTLNKMLDVAYKNSQRLNLLINDLLDMEKLLAGKMRFDHKAHVVSDLLAQAVESNQSYADQYQVHLEFTACEQDLNILVDASRFAQIMSNLLSNAAKYSPRGGTVKINAIREAGRVRISVKDEGEGIPEEFHSRIFQKFSQADSSDSRQKGGTGLGLAITRELVERMHGEIGFESGHTGTEFYMYFQSAPSVPRE